MNPSFKNHQFATIVFDFAINHLLTSASPLHHTSITEKYFSVHTHTKYLTASIYLYLSQEKKYSSASIKKKNF